MKVFNCDCGFVIFPFGSVSFCFLCLGVVSFRYMNIYRISVYWPIYLFGVTLFGYSNTLWSSVSSDVKTTTLTFLCFFSVWFIFFQLLSILLFPLYLKYIYYFSLLVVFLLFKALVLCSFMLKCISYLFT